MSSIIDYLHHLPLPSSEVSWQQLFTVKWWLQYLLSAYEANPYHVLVEVGCFVAIIWLWFFRSTYDPKEEAKLTRKEEAQLLAEWQPEPLVPPLSEVKKRERRRVVQSVTDAHTVVEGKECLNLASTNFAGLANNEEIKAECAKTIVKYGVGSCGPRGFYGSIDVHLQLEAKLAEFYGTKDAILYSDGIACVSSVIPAFAKRGDLIICDEGVHYGIQQGIQLSRSNVLYFKHNDLEDLERVLQDVREKDLMRGNKKLTRRFIVVEGVYQNYGDVCNLRKVMELKKAYKYRVMVDDSYALGVLGKTGRGSPEHWNVSMDEVEVLVAQLDAAIAGVGGFCVGLPEVVQHQRLSGAGYCFSASAPPYTATAGRVALEVLLREPKRLELARERATQLRRGLASIEGVEFSGPENLPIVHLRLKRSVGTRQADELFFDIVGEKLAESGVMAAVPKYIPQEREMPAPSLRVTVTARHSTKDVDAAVRAIKEAFAYAFSL